MPANGGLYEAHHAEIDVAKPAISSAQQVSRVRVCVQLDTRV